ncbi:hypothetical protein [Nocardia sp. bgisy134]|uniref:hypothetical protein n=1 Tax=Nocardia sp. bgisy134 TaxID=3413789 RepID=UPI003D742C08
MFTFKSTAVAAAMAAATVVLAVPATASANPDVLPAHSLWNGPGLEPPGVFSIPVLEPLRLFLLNGCFAIGPTFLGGQTGSELCSLFLGGTETGNP